MNQVAIPRGLDPALDLAAEELRQALFDIQMAEAAGTMPVVQCDAARCSAAAFAAAEVEFDVVRQVYSRRAVMLGISDLSRRVILLTEDLREECERAEGTGQLSAATADRISIRDQLLREQKQVLSTKMESLNVSVLRAHAQDVQIYTASVRQFTAQLRAAASSAVAA
jgi:hypothetical protein